MKTHKLVAALTLLTIACATQVTADSKDASKFVKALRQPSTKPDTQFDQLGDNLRAQANDADILAGEYKSVQARREHAQAYEKAHHTKFGGKANSAVVTARIELQKNETALKTQLQNMKTSQTSTIDKSIKKAQTHLDKNKPEQETKINDALIAIRNEPTAMPKELKVSKPKKEKSEKKPKVHAYRGEIAE